MTAVRPAGQRLLVPVPAYECGHTTCGTRGVEKLLYTGRSVCQSQARMVCNTDEPPLGGMPDRPPSRAERQPGRAASGRHAAGPGGWLTSAWQGDAAPGWIPTPTVAVRTREAIEVLAVCCATDPWTRLDPDTIGILKPATASDGCLLWPERCGPAGA